MQLNFNKNKDLAEEEFSERQTKLNTYPQMLAIYTTDVCNLRCVTCHFGQKMASPITITDEGYNRVFEVFPFLSTIGIAGAEMFYDAGNPKGYMQKVFDEGKKYEHIQFIGFSNGTLLTKERINLVVERFKWIGISIDSPDPNIYKSIRIGSNLDLVIQNIKKISGRKKQKGLGRFDHPEIIVSSVISERTFRSQIEMIDLAYEVGAASIHFQYPWEGTYVNENIFLDRKKTMEYLTLYQKAVTKAKEYGISIVDRTRNAIIQNLPDLKESLDASNDLKVDQWPNCCNAPWRELYIWRNGDVRTCCTSNLVFGNINHNNIFEIWNSPLAIRFRQQILNGYYGSCRANCYKGYILPLGRKRRFSKRVVGHLLYRKRQFELLMSKKKCNILVV